MPLFASRLPYSDALLRQGKHCPESDTFTAQDKLDHMCSLSNIRSLRLRGGSLSHTVTLVEFLKHFLATALLRI
jgi:hypothetical protein